MGIIALLSICGLTFALSIFTFNTIYEPITVQDFEVFTTESDFVTTATKFSGERKHYDCPICGYTFTEKKNCFLS